MSVSAVDVFIPYHDKTSLIAQVRRSLYKLQKMFCRARDHLQGFITSQGSCLFPLLVYQNSYFFCYVKRRRKGKRKDVKYRPCETNRNYRVFSISKKNSTYFVFTWFPAMVSFLLLIASDKFSLFSRMRRSCQYQNRVRFSAIKQWKSVVFMATSVTVGSAGSLERHTQLWQRKSHSEKEDNST